MTQAAGPGAAIDGATIRHAHFIAIGGAGMSGIARIMLRRGITVSGSDAKDSPILAQLAELGAEVFVGHSAEHLGDADTVVVSTAIRESNPELRAARERGLRVLHRSEALAALMAGRRAVAVAGTHGKTTTTSMLTVVLQHAGLDPAYCIGGQLVTTGLGADDGTGDVFVAEADESDGSFLRYSPHIAVVTNVEADHLDNYGAFEKVKENFARFVERIEPGGALVASADDPVAGELAGAARERGLTVVTYGESAGADLRLTGFTPRGLGSRFAIEGLGELTLEVPGRHYAHNATAALAVARLLGCDFATIRDGLASFTGSMRRLERKGEAGGVQVFDSYAHHPTELTADLQATREYLDQLAAEGRTGRIVAVFQPHLYSRTRFFATEFGRALGLADVAVVLDVYGAREDPEPGVSGRLIADAVPEGTRVEYVPVREQVPQVVAELARPGDLVLTLGAGDVTALGPLILERLA
ncbi:UDP-N-acetylmuramate--L-alanine ligase [Thermomonospora curvata]|uniref:UDP-N-acetylmuramate--L-alanine ligase n=1 Tax=Thermomonospora curvata (strain ATCC 19995 / DSM 43183 / JCM 3096 / KCTC 9072 / NBRC 15933 / NCIMB 10081 / Henssen B9) TaxID=471852 RepID=D1A7U5_THECD|nr:UDP-N-acetylmuramate--L-alanine ligase [Thermomonospora curvata]ACY98467.1 UDP-N-acetylmuramate/alanine ligase [Thermomonospora curvata DSM 43183]